jgi:predicted ATP-dependent endonuclease of OLD family
MYSEIKINKAINNYYHEDNSLFSCMNGLSKINIFVGANNSGKSRFMRELYKIEDYECHIKNKAIDSRKIVDAANFLIEQVLNIFKDFNSYTIIMKDGSLNQEDIKKLALLKKDFIKNNEINFEPLHHLLTRLLTTWEIRNSTYDPNLVKSRPDNVATGREIIDFLNKNKGKIDLLKNKYSEEKYNKCYIPILRTLNNFEAKDFLKANDPGEVVLGKFKVNDLFEKQDLYRNRLVRTYTLNSEIFTGLNLYQEIKEMLLGDHEERKKVKDFEEFLSRNFYNDQKISITPKQKSDVVTVKIGNQQEREIYNLGDGIQSIIMILFPIFRSEKDTIFFIEEPEMNLHPGLQRKLIEVLMNDSDLNKKNHQYFITSHSNHFLDLTLDYSGISIYLFKDRKNKKIIEQVNSGEENILRELGARVSSVFLTNATIWVEGITDRIYINKFLELYQEQKGLTKISEDVDYSILEYGGSNIAHWSFLNDDEGYKKINIERLCGKSMVVADKDDGKDKRHKKISNKFGERYIVLSSREIENYLSLKTIEQVIKSYPVDNDFSISMPKYENEYKKNLNVSYSNQKLAKFIMSKLKPNRNYIGANDVLKDKLNFAYKATMEMKYEDLTRQAKNIAKKIYRFIAEQNSK